MNPVFKGFRQRKDITRPITFNSSRKGFPGPSQNSDTEKMMVKTLLQMVQKIKGQSFTGETRGKYTSLMEPRDQYPLLQAPILVPDSMIRQKQIKMWLGDVCKRVFSTSFQFFKNKTLDTQMTKQFCSESLIGNILLLSRKNNLSSGDFKLINEHLKDELLPYFLLRYPQSNNKEVNLNLNKLISQTDAIETNENDLFMKSGIQFNFREDGQYNPQIMQFINYLLRLPKQAIQSSDLYGSSTVFDRFFQVMQRLFKSVQNRKWTETDLYNTFLNSDLSVEELKKKVQELEACTINKKQENDEKQYAYTVQQYTNYAINRKISENVPLYSSDEILFGNITIKNSAVLRIIVKWCKELEQKYAPDYFIDRDEPFVMLNKGEVDMVSDIRIELDKIAQEQWKQIKKYLKNISRNIDENQSQLSYHNLMFYSDHKLPEFEETLIKFASKNTSDYIHYATSYLNRLIHGLLNISNKLYSNQLQGWAQWPYPPELITFTISDLIRCKCFSEQKQIIRIYKQLEIQSEIAPQKLRIIKVKNRLNRGTKDILLNVLFYGKALCEIQLAIKVDVSNFILYSDKFNHYIYELKRSIFGPINEACSIWSAIDERSKLLKDQRIFLNFQKEHICFKQLRKSNENANIEQILEIQDFPFTCTNCERHYSLSKYIFYHKVCHKCRRYWLCAKCRMEKLDEKQLMQELGLSEEIVTRRIYSTNQQCQYYLIFKIQSARILPRYCRLIRVDTTPYLVYFKQNRMCLWKVTDHQKLISDFVVFELKKSDEELLHLTVQDVMDYLVLEQIQESYNKKWEAIRIADRNITKQILLKIDDIRGQSYIKNLSFPNNYIKSLQQIGQRFKNVRFLNLNQNGLESMKGIKHMTALTDVYLGHNKFTEIVELENLPRLKYIQLGNNPMAPQFKCNLSNLRKLESLTLVGSELSEFPVEVLEIPNLKLLWLFENKIKKIPEEIGKLKFLENLNMSYNEIEHLPKSLFTLKNLKNCAFDSNKLTELPEEVENLKNLKTIHFFYNKFNPQTFPIHKVDKLPYLEAVYLDSNMRKSILSIVQTARSQKYVYCGH